MARSYKSAIGWTSSGYHDPRRGIYRHNIANEIAVEYVEDGSWKTVLDFAAIVENCIAFYDIFKSRAAEQGPSPGDIRKEFEEIRDTARRLEKLLLRLSDPAQKIIHSLDLQAGETIDIISELRACVERAYSMASRAVGKGKKSRPQTDEHDLAHQLIKAYAKLTGEIPKMGRDAIPAVDAIPEFGDRQFKGIFHHFVSDVFNRYGIDYSPHTIAGYIKTYLHPPSP